MKSNKSVLAMLMVILISMLVACSAVGSGQAGSTSPSNNAMIEEKSGEATMEEKDGEMTEKATIEEKMEDDSMVDDRHSNEAIMEEKDGEMYNHLKTSDFIRDIVDHPAFEGFGELLLPREKFSGYENSQLREVGSLMPYHSHVEPVIVVGALNYMIDEIIHGRTIFYDFYSEQEKQENPAKAFTGLFFFRGEPGAPFAVICPGGGFSYVGSLHEGFPLAQRISEFGLNAFVIRYRIGSERYATADLAAAIAYIFRNAEVLGVDTNDYAPWGLKQKAKI